MLATGMALAAGGVGYVVGRSGGEDLDRARSEGRAAGERSGSARGAQRGYREGLQEGRRRTYRDAYERALTDTLGEGSEPSTTPVSRSCGNLAEEGAGTYKVQSVDVICDIARQVATQWEMECTQTRSACTVRAGFSCSFAEAGIEQVRVTCVDGERRVTFESGA